MPASGGIVIEIAEVGVELVGLTAFLLAASARGLVEDPGLGLDIA